MNESKTKTNKFHILEDVEAFRKSLIEDGDEELVKFLESIDKEFEKMEPMELQRLKKGLGLE